MLLPPGIATFIDTMFDQIQQIAEHAYANGYKAGSSLLNRLAEGTVSIDEFNNRTMGENQ